MEIMYIFKEGLLGQYCKPWHYTSNYKHYQDKISQIL